MAVPTFVSVDTVNQAYRVPGVVAPAVAATAAGATPDTAYQVADEFIRAVPFAIADGNTPYGRQYVVRVSALAESGVLVATATSTAAITPGATTEFGQELSGLATAATPNAGRFKKASLFVRADQTMVDGRPDDDVFQIQIKLAGISIVRELSRAVLQSLLSIASDAANHAGLLGLRGYAADASFSSQLVAWTGSINTMTKGLSALEARCHPSNGDFGAGPDVFVVSTGQRWRLMQELEAAGCLDFRDCALTGKLQLHYHGIPVLMGRVFEADVGTGHDAWALKLSGPSGIKVLHIGGDSHSFGLRTEARTTVPQFTGSATTNTTAGVEVFGIYSLVVPEVQSIARLSGIPPFALT